MKNLTYDEEVILSVIPTGKENAVLQRDITKTTNIGKRHIVYIVNSLRKKGYPICSTTYDGYWLASNKGEIIETMKALLSKQETIAETISNLSECMEKMR